VGDGAPDQAAEGGAAGGVLPDRDESAHQPLAEPVDVALEQFGDERGGVDRWPDDGEEELLLGAEVVVDQRRVDARAGGDLADRRAVVPPLPERLARGLQDEPPRVLMAGASTRPPYHPTS
jgi:hypothetical protein